MYRTRDVVLDPAPYTEATALGWAQPLSHPFPLTAEDSLQLRVLVKLSAITWENQDIWLRLQHYIHDAWHDVAIESVDTAYISYVDWADTDVVTGTDRITITAHGRVTGDRVLVSTNGGTLPTGLAANTEYWIIKIDDNTVKFATSLANALAGTAIDLTAAGAGTSTLHAADYTIQVSVDNSAWRPYLPMGPLARVAVQFYGSASSITVSHIYVSNRT